MERLRRKRINMAELWKILFILSIPIIIYMAILAWVEAQWHSVGMVYWTLTWGLIPTAVFAGMILAYDSVRPRLVEGRRISYTSLNFRTRAGIFFVIVGIVAFWSTLQDFLANFFGGYLTLEYSVAGWFGGYVLIGSVAIPSLYFIVPVMGILMVMFGLWLLKVEVVVAGGERRG
ncbi:MAG: hypothetical protein ACTSPL_04050 [Candidatus Odinarchaeia archaeon]